MNKYTYDIKGINEFLYNIGILPLVVSFDERQLPENMLKVLKVIQTTERKKLKYQPKNLGIRTQDPEWKLENYGIADLVSIWKMSRNVYDALSKEWEELNNSLLAALINEVKKEFDYR